MAVQRRVELFPGVADGRLMQEAVNDKGMVPVGFVAAVFVVPGDVIEITVTTGEEPATETACPVPACQLWPSTLRLAEGRGRGRGRGNEGWG